MYSLFDWFISVTKNIFLRPALIFCIIVLSISFVILIVFKVWVASDLKKTELALQQVSSQDYQRMQEEHHLDQLTQKEIKKNLMLVFIGLLFLIVLYWILYLK